MLKHDISALRVSTPCCSTWRCSLVKKMGVKTVDLLHLWKRVKLLKQLFRLVMVETILGVRRSHAICMLQETLSHLLMFGILIDLPF